MELVLGNGYGNGWLLNNMNRFWREAEGGAELTMIPPADVVEHGDGYHFYFEMPGIKPDSFEVRVEDGRLVIEAERKRPEWPKDAELHVAERRYGSMRRAFTMPEDASEDGVRASYRDGVLEVTVPKKPEAKPTKIKVNVEN